MAEPDVCDGLSGGEAAEMDNVCRDFLRNVCRRGKRCKYRHPDPSEVKEMGGKVEFIFCHDFQNKECRRLNCKFIHCSRADEEYYQACGELPAVLSDGGYVGGGGDDLGGVGLLGGGGGLNDNSHVPVCKDFIKGDCHRGGRCKFRHVNEYMDMGGGVGGGGNRRNFGGGNGMGLGGPGSGFGGGGSDFGGGGGDFYEPDRKRRMFAVGGGGGGNGMGVDNFGGGVMALPPPPPMPPPPPNRHQQMAPPPPPLNAEFYILEEENAFLRRKVEELKKQVADLTATNEFLLDQNAQLRLAGKQGGPGVGGPGGGVPQGGGGSNPAPPPGMPPPQLPPPPMPGDPAPPPGAVVPVSLAAAPVSISQAIPAASLPQNPLISYPIMTQNMRPALAPSTLPH